MFKKRYHLFVFIIRCKPNMENIKLDVHADSRGGRVPERPSDFEKDRVNRYKKQIPIPRAIARGIPPLLMPRAMGTAMSPSTALIRGKASLI